MMDNERTLKVLASRLFGNPFLPLLFLSESIKISIVSGPNDAALKMAGLFAISSVVWILSDAISVDVDEDKIIG